MQPQPFSPNMPVQYPESQVARQGPGHVNPLCNKHGYHLHHVNEEPSQKGRPHHQDVR